ncbi:hypothetical protein DICPUDRAFT_157915 [Dictyostelium purpureum]|uniref:Inositolphosphotransferase Aur1/Ipt1 domain-containing protein n=1 Tax=Dictyostelium purpureum TaxID=5786 RepID=F1A0C2_DICPU|nr:uncharacterized protein DICPUDRAFT_157915 [Dictyostelium purpureum]EGC30352.1 hypothetical protein DICPUDRAFT_157915 [Dictyostelium purpureum]|eukprot:XP_003293122.1 hypothetical protein DICPUDRAFT_157915 [Dictyostelium purpureum]
MGVQQQVELQPQSTVKYFHLKEEDASDINDIDIIKESSAPPRLSLMGWFAPPQYTAFPLGKIVSGSSKNPLSLSEDSISSLDDKSIGIHTQPILMESSDGEDGAGPKDFKIDIHPTSSMDKDIDDLKYNKKSTNTFLYSNAVTNNNSIRYQYSPVYSDVTYTLLVGIVILFSIVYSLLVGPIKIMFAFLISLTIFISYTCAALSTNNRTYLYSVTVLSIALGLTIPAFFAATGAVVIGTDRNKILWDSRLYASDSFLMGWLWPNGQMAKFVEDSTIVGPSSFIGKLSTEVFQLSYISYYVWGYLMEVYILWNLWRCHLSTDPQKQRMMPIWDQRLKMFICSWISTYFIVFSINLIFPAISPRVYLKNLYSEKLTGFGFAGFIREKIDNAATGSFGSFPSGHIATSFAVGLSSYKILPAYGFVSTISAILIAIATMYLRYHYFVDFLAAIPVTMFCLLYGGYYSPSDFFSVFVKCFTYTKTIIQKTFQKIKNF